MKNRKRKNLHMLVCTLSVILLVFSTIQPAYANVHEPETETEESLIQELLSAGEYVEGEAIVLLKGSLKPDVSASVEELSDVTADSVELAVSSAEENGETAAAAAQEAEERVTTGAAPESFSVQHIVNHDRTTEELLRELYADPDVISAEPNYVIVNPNTLEDDLSEVQSEGASENLITEDDPSSEIIPDPETKEIQEPLNDASGTETEELFQNEQTSGSVQEAAAGDFNNEAGQAPAVLSSEPVGIGQGDLTPLQWYAGNTGIGCTTPIAPFQSYYLNVPGWLEGRTDENAPANASGTICIMDTGIDVTHPDLQDVMYEFTPEQQARYGCGAYGMNASGDGLDSTDVTDYYLHGTHVAGIVAAKWDRFGVSGIANGVRLFSVRIFGAATDSNMASVIQGFQFLIDVAQEVNLKVVNCSWGSGMYQFVYSVMVNELGKKGVNTVFSSGNSAIDTDENVETGGSVNSVYAIKVNAASPNGERTDFTCWGQASTHLFVPGVQFLSTMPEPAERDNKIVNDGTRFYPEATAAENLVFGIERFSGEKTAVRCFDANPALSSDAEEIGTVTDTAGFDDKRSAAVRVASLKSSGSGPSGLGDTENGSVFLAIPVTSTEAAKWISVKCAMNDPFRPQGILSSVTCADADGKPVQVDTTCSYVLGTDVRTGAMSGIYQCQWTMLSCNVDAYIEAANTAHNILKEHSDKTWLEDNGYGGLVDYTDVGEIAGLYLWNDGGTGYIIAEVGLGPARSGSVQDSTVLYLDNIAVGGPDAYREAYSIQCGTSMAAPIVTGALAVIAKDETPSAELNEEELEQQALERAAKLLATVEGTYSLSDLCRTGGLLNFDENPDFTKKAPLIKSCSVSEGVLAIEGYFFGDSGDITIDGEQQSVMDWNENLIQTDVSFMENGPHSIEISNSDRKTMKTVFFVSQEYSSGRLLYENEMHLPYEGDFIEVADCDRIGGDAAVCGGYLYTFSIFSTMDEEIKELWCYNIAYDFWIRRPMPENFVNMPDMSGTLTVAGDTLYLYGFRDQEKKEAGIWSYDQDKGEWTLLPVAVPAKTAVCGFQDKLIFVGEAFSVLDPETETLTVLSGQLPASFDYGGHAIAASGDKIWFYFTSVDEQEKVTGFFIRASYQEETAAMEVEDLSSVFTEAIGGDPDFWKKFGKKNITAHCTLAGLSDGVAVIGSSISGEDTHFISDTATEAVLYDRTSSYFMLTDPVAAYADGRLYVIAESPNEKDVQFFRSTQISEESQDVPEESSVPIPAAADSETVPEKVQTGDDTLIWPWIVLLVAAGLAIAVAVIIRKRSGPR